jgi:hypothetical protein
MPEMGDFMSNARLKTRSNFATQHLRSAIQDALGAHAVEQANDTSNCGPWFDDLMMHVPTSVIMSAAALEANSNEIIQDLIDRLSNNHSAATTLQGLTQLREDRSGWAMGKYEKLAGLLNKTANTSSPIWLDAVNLFRFRNSFMHFKPAWDHDADVHNSELVEYLKTRLPIVAGYDSHFIFPYGFLSYRCAKWAVETARGFATDFSALIGEKDRFAGGAALP